MSGVFRLGVEVESHLVYGEGRTHTVVDGVTVDGRSVVLIDPDDREQVERLLDIESRITTGGDPRVLDPVQRVQAALREFANPTPPRPDEPTGWLAAVVDMNGNRWCRVEGPVDPPKDWYSPDLNESRAYADIAAVRVLSEGVSS